MGVMARRLMMARTGVSTNPPGYIHWYDSSITSPAQLYQDTALTTPSAVSDPVGAWREIIANRHALQATAGLRPTRLASGVDFDGSDDYLQSATFSTAGLPLSGFALVVCELDASVSANIPIFQYLNSSAATSGALQIFYDGAATRFRFESRYDASFRNVGLTVAAGGMATSTKYVLGLASSGTNYKFNRNNFYWGSGEAGTITYSAGSDNGNYLGDIVNAGGDPNTLTIGDPLWNGKIYEIVSSNDYSAYKTTVDALRTKWGTA